MSSAIDRQRDGPILWLRLARPAAFNALDRDMCTALRAAVADDVQDATIRVIVLTATGRAFCTGADLKQMLASLDAAADAPDLLDDIVATLDAVRACPKPVIAGINGLTLAGGLELALCCDVILAADSAEIGDGHAVHAMLPGGGSAVLLGRRLGPHRAKAILLSGDRWPAAQWAEWGIVHRVVAAAELDKALHQFATRIASHEPVVVRTLKRIVDDSTSIGQQAALRDELLALRDHMRTDAFRAGLARFADRRGAGAH